MIPPYLNNHAITLSFFFYVFFKLQPVTLTMFPCQRAHYCCQTLENLSILTVSSHIFLEHSKYIYIYLDLKYNEFLTCIHPPVHFLSPVWSLEPIPVTVWMKRVPVHSGKAASPSQ